MLRDSTLTSGINYHPSFKFSFLQRGARVMLVILRGRTVRLTLAYWEKATGEKGIENRHCATKARAGRARSERTARLTASLVASVRAADHKQGLKGESNNGRETSFSPGSRWLILYKLTVVQIGTCPCLQITFEKQFPSVFFSQYLLIL